MIDCSLLTQQEEEISQEYSPSFQWGFVKHHSSCISMNDKLLLRSDFYVSEHVIIDYSNLTLEKSIFIPYCSLNHPESWEIAV